ncbi:MAG TPA: MMPL family transporter [Actinomycetes bacterium]|nr:MMPL family transporter [Actinomycetes bacterium]
MLVLLLIIFIIFGGRTAARRLERRAGLRSRARSGLATALSMVLAAGMPLVLAAVAVAGAFLILLGLSHATEISSYSVNVVTMLGLGLAVDYSLLVVSRFREERAGGLDLPLALERTLASAGRTVAFSGLTVAVSLAGLLVFAEPFLRSLAWGGIGVVLVAMLAAITLVPALLAIWGGRIRSPRARPADHGFFYRQSRLVQRFAPAIVPLVALVLLLAALPFRHAQLEKLGARGPAPLVGVPPAVRDLAGPLPGRGHRPAHRGGRRRPPLGAAGRLRAPDPGAARRRVGPGPAAAPADADRGRRRTGRAEPGSGLRRLHDRFGLAEHRPPPVPVGEPVDAGHGLRTPVG